MLLIAATVVSPSFKLWNLFEGSRGGCTAWWMLEKSSLRELLSERYSLHHDRGRELALERKVRREDGGSRVRGAGP
jgi:hypothetical protein